MYDQKVLSDILYNLASGGNAYPLYISKKVIEADGDVNKMSYEVKSWVSKTYNFIKDEYENKTGKYLPNIFGLTKEEI